MPAVKSEIKSILQKKYGIKALDIRKIKVGVINSNYIAGTGTEEFIFKIYNLHDYKEVRFETDLLEFLGEKAFPCPRIIRNKEREFSVSYKGKPAVLLNYIPGEMALKLTPGIMHEVGMLAGRLHKLLRNFKQTIRIKTWEPEDIRRFIKQESRNIIKKKYPDAKAFVSYVAEEFDSIRFSSGLPVGMTHQDIKPENIIVSNNKISFIDFNNCYRGILIYDVMTAVIWSCFRKGVLQESLFESYIKGYSASRIFTNTEKDYFFDALRFRLLRETFVWPMRFSPSVAVEKGESFLLSYRNLMKNEERYKKLIDKILR